MPRLLCFSTLLAACLVVAPAQADARQGPEIQTDDVTRFYALYDATHGQPTVEQIDKDYLAKGTQSLGEFAKLRRVTAQSIADRLKSLRSKGSGKVVASLTEGLQCRTC